MKFILSVVTAVVILLASVNAEDEDDSMLKEMASACIEKTGATDDDIKSLISKKVPETKTGKCFSFCIMNQFNCFSDTGDFMELVKMQNDNETMVLMIDEVSSDCVGTKDPNNDNCETAALFLQCMEDGATNYKKE